MIGKVAAFFRFVIAALMHNPIWSLVAAVAIALIANVSTIQYIFSLQNNLEGMFKTDLIGQNYIQTARIKLLSINKDLNNLFLLTDVDEKYLVTEKILTHKREVGYLIAKSKPFYGTKKSARLVGEAGASFADCAITIDSLIVLSKTEATVEAVDVITGPMKHEFETLDSLLGYLDGVKQRHDIRLYKNIDYQLTISIIFTLVALVITIGVRIFVYQNAKKPSKTHNTII
ncbi:MAG TPA: MCP four helix bundle domain-containing protein [Chitinivibrionales bacterium]|jgi:hypothetical protein|nr:MCP four helix bundle domain-containing protein [Chitinivibrionales bacterium]